MYPGSSWNGTSYNAGPPFVNQPVAPQPNYSLEFTPTFSNNFPTNLDPVIPQGPAVPSYGAPAPYSTNTLPLPDYNYNVPSQSLTNPSTGRPMSVIQQRLLSKKVPSMTTQPTPSHTSYPPPNVDYGNNQYQNQGQSYSNVSTPQYPTYNQTTDSTLQVPLPQNQNTSFPSYSNTSNYPANTNPNSLNFSNYDANTNNTAGFHQTPSYSNSNYAPGSFSGANSTYAPNPSSYSNTNYNPSSTFSPRSTMPTSSYSSGNPTYPPQSTTPSSYSSGNPTYPPHSTTPASSYSSGNTTYPPQSTTPASYSNGNPTYPPPASTPSINLSSAVNPTHPPPSTTPATAYSGPTKNTFGPNSNYSNQNPAVNSTYPPPSTTPAYPAKTTYPPPSTTPEISSGNAFAPPPTNTPPPFLPSALPSTVSNQKASVSPSKSMVPQDDHAKIPSSAIPTYIIPPNQQRNLPPTPKSASSRDDMGKVTPPPRSATPETTPSYQRNLPTPQTRNELNLTKSLPAAATRPNAQPAQPAQPAQLAQPATRSPTHIEKPKITLKPPRPSQPLPATPTPPPASPRSKLNQSKEDQIFYSVIINTFKLLVTNTGRIKFLLDEEYEENVKNNSFDFLNEVLENFKTSYSKLEQLLLTNVMKIEEGAFQQIKGKVGSFSQSSKALLELANDMKNPINHQKYTTQPKREKSHNVKQHVIAVTYSIKELITTLERQKLVNEASNAIELIGKEETIQPAVETAQTQYERVSYQPERPLSSYNNNHITKLQKLFKAVHTKSKVRAFVKEYSLSAPAKNERLRNKALYEFLTTEETYVKSLEIVIDRFLNPLRTAFQKGQKIVAQDVIKKLFGNVETIHKFNLGILCKFKQRLSEYNGSFGDIFLDTIPQMDLYVSYINNYGLAIDTYKLSSSEKRFKTFCEEALQDIGGKLDLPAYLIMPVQRLPRYDLLLRELLKLTPENHVDYNNLVKAKDEIQKMNEFINDKQQEHENRLKLEQLQSKIVTSIPLVLTVPNRLFLREGKVNISKNNSSEVKGTLIAMNDILLLTKRDSTSIDRNIKKITSLILDVVPVIEQPKEEDEMILMDTVKFADKFTLRNEGGVQFTLCCGSDTWTITCENEKEQKNWIKALTEAIDTFSLNSTLDETMAQLNTDFNVIQARYGNLNRQAQVVDVTQILQKLVTEQGGSQLIIYPPAKKTLFGKLLSSSVKNKTLAIVYSLNGDVKIETYATDDTVKIGNLAQ